MIYIAHRGLFNGPNKKLENQPQQIRSALELGFHCEVDLWVIDDTLYLGHDEPQYHITPEFLEDDRLWIHAKNLSALNWLVNQRGEHNYFWHESDKYTLTSKHFIWTNPGNSLSNNSVMVMPEHEDETLSNAFEAECYAICSDYVKKIKETR